MPIDLGDGMKIRRRLQHHQIVRQTAELRHGIRAGYRNRDHDPGRSRLVAHLNSRMHRRSHGDTVIGQDDRPSLQRRERTAATQNLDPAPDLLLLLSDDLQDLRFAHRDGGSGIDVDRPILGNGPEATLRIERIREFSADQQIEIGSQIPGDFVADLGPASRNRQDQKARRSPIGLQGSGKPLSRIFAILKHRCLLLEYFIPYHNKSLRSDCAIIPADFSRPKDAETVQSSLPLIDDFRSIVVDTHPLIDLRAPVEYERGSFPDTVNLPLLTDEEREAVGTTYKREGNEAAVALGHRIVSGKVKEKRIAAWIEFIREHPDTYLFCWRGGQRSRIVQEWLAERGVVVPRIKGGYKAFRRYLMEESLRLAKNKEILVIGGRTGSGKTLLLRKIPEAIDLEGIARHRGSAFGRYATPQPPQIAFENALAYAQIRHDEGGYRHLVIEDESRNIGQRYIPPELFEEFQKGKVILLETPLVKRIEITYDDYILYAQKEYDEAHARGVAPYDWFETMQHNFRRIRKRLGDERYRRFSAMLEAAWEEQQRTGNPEGHKIWIRALLEEYYDPMYDWQISRKSERIVFRGDEREVLEYLASLRKE